MVVFRLTRKVFWLGWVMSRRFASGKRGWTALQSVGRGGHLAAVGTLWALLHVGCCPIRREPVRYAHWL